MARIGLLGVLAAATLLAGASDARTSAEAAPLRVLFIGSSGIRSNNMPARVAELAAASGRKLQYRTVASPGFSLEDHWSFGAARPALASGVWDVVVMQDGFAIAPSEAEHLSTWASRFADLARIAGTRPALLMVAPDRQRRSLLPDVIASYRMAAQAAGAELFPGGEAWQAAWRCKPYIWFYGPDNVHPSRLGTYVWALVTYGALYDAPVRSRRLYPVGEMPWMSRLLQASAATALGRWLPASGRCG